MSLPGIAMPTGILVALSCIKPQSCHRSTDHFCQCQGCRCQCFDLRFHRHQSHGRSKQQSLLLPLALLPPPQLPLSLLGGTAFTATAAKLAVACSSCLLHLPPWLPPLACFDCFLWLSFAWWLSFALVVFAPCFVLASFCAFVGCAYFCAAKLVPRVALWPLLGWCEQLVLRPVCLYDSGASAQRPRLGLAVGAAL